jgi:hypothetical protein
MKPELVDRRREMIKYHVRGIPSKQWIPLVSTQFNISEDRVYSDYRNIKRWLPEMISLKDSEAITNMVFTHLQQALNAAWQDRQTATRETTKLRCLELIGILAQKYLELAQSVGRVEKIADRADTTKKPSKDLKNLLNRLVPKKEEQDELTRSVQKLDSK